ncbi:hypothetical protein FB567DRAFT_545565 [Paraphoma chrysanthemicola]|uniref:Cytidyltransferase-like domain-containing protein n=1 Tax=Paraphoma chrysanthemicola TaxID=798071 RepID=A0A8K0REN3_9PLEO|nr:hypothetical protein FB567DRAFT_545565 [Paraphoma chrysanthemicola]
MLRAKPGDSPQDAQSLLVVGSPGLRCSDDSSISTWWRRWIWSSFSVIIVGYREKERSYAVNVGTKANQSSETQYSKSNKQLNPESTEDFQDTAKDLNTLHGLDPTGLVQRQSGHVSLEITPPTIGRVRFADLEDYILRAERTSIDVPLADRHTLFRRVKGVQPPRLRSDRNNIVLIYPGCFNPPHLGHLALLWHAFLCTDDKTVAAMFLPLGNGSLSQKASTVELGRSFKLSHKQRSKLLEDEILSRFSWVYPGPALDSAEFILRLQELAKVDGFRVSFPSLHGGDNFGVFNFEGSLGWGTGNIVSSNIGRPMSRRDNINNDFGPPHQLPTFEPWKRLSRAKPRSTRDTIWQAERKLFLGTDYVIFIPKGVHSGSGNQDPNSSTLIRRTFFSTGLEQDNFRSLAAKLVPNPDLPVKYINQTEED